MGNGLTNYRQAKRDDVPPAYWLSTKDVAQFLQERVDIIVATIRKNNPEYSNLENIPVSVAGGQASHSFCPIAVVLPPEALESESSNVGKNVPSVFKQRDEEAQLQLIPELEKFFKLYIYNKEDKKEVADGQKSNGEVQTGDTSPVGTAAGLLLVSGGVIIGTEALRRRKND